MRPRSVAKRVDLFSKVVAYVGRRSGDDTATLGSEHVKSECR